MTSDYDAIIVGSGPNGLSAAITLAEQGISVLVLEAHEHIGGGTRSAELTLPGFTHDVCSAIHPMAALSPAFRSMALETRGVTWIEPPAALVHPLDDGRAALLRHSLDETALGLDTDADSYRTLLGSWVTQAPTLFSELLGPLRVPRHPFLLAGFGWTALKSAERLARHCFKTVPARALFAGCAAHSLLPFDAPASSAIGLMLLLAAHAVGWPVAKGGSSAICGALADYLTSLGGVIQTCRRVNSWVDIPKSRVVMFDTSPAFVQRRASSSSTGHWMVPFRGRASNVGKPVPFTSVARLRKSRLLNRRSTEVSTRNTPTSWLRSKVFSIQRGPRQASIRVGPIVTFPTDPRSK